MRKDRQLDECTRDLHSQRTRQMNDNAFDLRVSHTVRTHSLTDRLNVCTVADVSGRWACGEKRM